MSNPKKVSVPAKCRYCMYWVSGYCRALPKFPQLGLYEVEIRVGLFGRKERVLRSASASPWHPQTQPEDGCALFVHGTSEAQS